MPFFLRAPRLSRHRDERDPFHQSNQHQHPERREPRHDGQCDVVGAGILEGMNWFLLAAGAAAVVEISGPAYVAVERCGGVCEIHDGGDRETR